MPIKYRYFNANPLNRKEKDCVCRAISRALRLSYDEVEYKLALIGELFDCDKLCVRCYAHLLEEVFGLQPHYAHGKTVKELARKYPRQTIIIRLDGHLTVVENGVLYDTRNCRNAVADMFWIV